MPGKPIEMNSSKSPANYGVVMLTRGNLLEARKKRGWWILLHTLALLPHSKFTAFSNVSYLFTKMFHCPAQNSYSVDLLHHHIEQCTLYNIPKIIIDGPYYFWYCATCNTYPSWTTIVPSRFALSSLMMLMSSKALLMGLSGLGQCGAW